jgi:hypothetical protein
MVLVQIDKGVMYIHGVSDNVSSLIDLYFKYRKHFGYMEVMDDNDNYKVLATLGSKINK